MKSIHTNTVNVYGSIAIVLYMEITVNDIDVTERKKQKTFNSFVWTRLYEMISSATLLYTHQRPKMYHIDDQMD